MNKYTQVYTTQGMKFQSSWTMIVLIISDFSSFFQFLSSTKKIAERKGRQAF